MRQRFRCVLVASFVLAAVGCSSANPTSSGGSGSSSAASTTTAVSSSPSSTTAADPKASAQQALDAYWRMVKRLNAAPDPNDAEIAQRAVDPSLSAIRDLLTTRQAQGEAVQYDGVPYSVTATVSSVNGSTADFSACLVDGARVVVVSSGQVVDDKVTTSLLKGTLTLGDGGWKVARFDVVRKAEGAVSCDSLA